VKRSVETFSESGLERSDDNSFPRLLLDAWLFCIPVFLITVALKFLVTRESGDRSFSLTLLYIRMFSGEFWEALVLVPAIMIVIGRVLPDLWRRWIYFLIAEIIALDAVVHWATFRTMGEFPSRELTGDFLATLRSNPAFLSPSNLLDRKERMVFITVIVVNILPLLVSYWGLSRVRPIWLRHYKWAFPIVGVCLLIVGILPLHLAGSNMERAGVVERTAAEILKADEADEALNQDELRESPKEAYERVSFPAGVPKVQQDNPVVAAIGHALPRTKPNVIFIVLETTGSKDYPFSGPDSKMPHVASLLEHSLVAQRHFSTDIESLRANFSIYTSLYDLPGQGHAQYFGRHLLSGGRIRALDALPQILSDRGYVTRYYFPSLLWPKAFEEDSLHLYGFQSIHTGYDVPVSNDPQQELAQWNRLTVLSSPAEKMESERHMYQMAINDIAEFNKTHKPFFLSLVASIGHAPFSDIRPPEEIAQAPNPTRKVLIDNLAAFQDQLIGALLDKLKQFNLLDDTILLITGDHGPRTRLDDPDLDLIFANEESYHVPLLIYCPAIFQKPMNVDRVTSHLDVAPTILDMMDLHSRDYMQEGASMLDAALDDRITYFLGQHLRGFDTAYYRGQFLMYSYDRQAAYLNTSFQFNEKNRIEVSASTPQVKSLSKGLMGLRHVQELWISYFRNPQ
jgi:arylsulfatase A-like enzyme